jgi:hypothetical protein
MKQSPSLSVCKHSAKRIESLLGKSGNLLLSVRPLSSQARLDKEHKCDQVKLPQIISQMDRLSTAKPATEKPFRKQRKMHLPHATLTSVHQEVVMTQCCVNQKYRHYCIHQEMNNSALLYNRIIQHGFREYFFAYKQFKNLAMQTILHAKKYQIDLLKDEKPEEWPKDLHPIKTEERHFRIGHTIKH